MAFINAISYYLPETALSNEYFNELFPEWSVDKIAKKTGILERRVANSAEFVSDLAVKAASNLFQEHGVNASDIDFILLCTQSPDYLLPTTACIVQEALGIPTSAGALDFNLGCSGYIYGLGLAKGLILTGDAANVLLITSETYSKHLDPGDKSVRTIFGDAAAATLVSRKQSGGAVQRSAFGTDGRGAENLIVKRGAMKGSSEVTASSALYMNGAEIFTFTLKVVPDLVRTTLEKNGLQVADIDLFVFHQANKYMLEHLREKMNIPQEKFYIHMENCGNTVSSTIPIALYQAEKESLIRPGMKVLLAGFGVGYSWGATVIQY
jgi:3-oxoacyl-[acyl-carrier-protein] synthase-3